MKRISFMTTLLLLPLILGLCACQMFQRSDPYLYQGLNPREYELQKDRQEYKEDIAREELGVPSSYALSEEQEQQLRLRMQLKNLEAKLLTSREKEQYYRYKGKMESDSERIYFLSLPNLPARERWAQNRGLHAENDGFPDHVAEIIERGDIAVGMTPKAVLEAWGDPDFVEVAGNPLYGNERWRFSKYISSDEGYQRVERIIYFESGKVVGWETI